MTLSDDAWKEELLQNLESAGGQAAHTAAYLRGRRVAIISVDNGATNLWWKPRFGWRGPRLENRLYLSRYLRGQPPHSPWLMASIVHEVRHLEQGFWTAFSVYGELEAWQVGFRFYQTLPGAGPLSPPLRALLNLPLSHDRAVLRQARRLINQDQNRGTSLCRQVCSVIKDRNNYHRIYWILLLPLNPLFH